MRVEPLKMEPVGSEDLEEDEDEDEEKEKEGNSLLSYFPCLVLALILVVILASSQHLLLAVGLPHVLLLLVCLVVGHLHVLLLLDQRRLFARPLALS